MATGAGKARPHRVLNYTVGTPVHTVSLLTHDLAWSQETIDRSTIIIIMITAAMCILLTDQLHIRTYPFCQSTTRGISTRQAASIS